MAQQVFRYFRELFNIQLSSFETIFLLSNAKLLYTSSKVYKEAGVAVVAVADVVRFNCRELVDLRRRRVQKVGCRKNTACIEKKFLSSRKCVEPDFLFGAKIQTAISPLAETGATRSIRLVSVQCKEREKMTFLVRFFFF